MITPQTQIERINDGFLVSELGNDLVMMNTETGDYIGLNEVAADIWKLIEQPRKTDEIIASLQQQYDVPAADCEAQTLACLDKMLKQGLIKAE